MDECLNCKKELNHTKGRRKKKFCSDKCRMDFNQRVRHLKKLKPVKTDWSYDDFVKELEKASAEKLPKEITAGEPVTIKVTMNEKRIVGWTFDARDSYDPKIHADGTFSVKVPANKLKPMYEKLNKTNTDSQKKRTEMPAAKTIPKGMSLDNRIKWMEENP